MIPKIIHYCWLSGDPYPELIRKCLDTWNEHLKDYEIWLWDKERFDIESVVWTKEAYECKKYAFAADYIRLFALYNYGGIYLDSDVTVYKSFDDLLDRPYFIGEDYMHCFEPAIIGAEKGCIWIRDVLERYEKRHFIKNDGSQDLRGLPYVFFDQLSTRYSFRLINKGSLTSDDSSVINVFPMDYFNSRDYIGVAPTINSYCAHNYLGSWLKSTNGFKLFVKRHIPHKIAYFYYKFITEPSPVAIPYSDKF